MFFVAFLHLVGLYTCRVLSLTCYFSRMFIVPAGRFYHKVLLQEVMGGSLLVRYWL